jgi:hypothetical protein
MTIHLQNSIPSPTSPPHPFTIYRYSEQQSLLETDKERFDSFLVGVLLYIALPKVFVLEAVVCGMGGMIEQFPISPIIESNSQLIPESYPKESKSCGIGGSHCQVLDLSAGFIFCDEDVLAGGDRTEKHVTLEDQLAGEEVKVLEVGEELGELVWGGVGSVERRAGGGEEFI